MDWQGPLPTKRAVDLDRETGAVNGSLAERAAVHLLQAGSKLSSLFAHRGYRFGCRAFAVAFPDREVVVRLNADSLFAIPLGDGYWSKILNRAFVYEEEIDVFLSAVADTKYVFVDGGANFGYWSVLASSAAFGKQKAIAIEASSANVARLQHNAALNGNRFRVLNVALGRHTVGFAAITGRRHKALSTMSAEAGLADAVPVVSLDSLIQDGTVSGAERKVVKLDVEGVEIDAIRGGMGMLDNDAVVICEEHGSDREHRVSRWLIGSGFHVYILDPAVGRFLPVTEMEILKRIKKHRRVGYNIFATSSAFWEERLLSASRSGTPGREGIPAAGSREQCWPKAENA